MYAYNEILKEKNKKKTTLYEKVYARAGIKDLSIRYLKYYRNSRKAPELRFNIALLTYDQGNQEEVILLG